MGSFGIQMGTIKARKPLVSLLFFVRENIINIVINIVINNIKRKSLILRLWITPRLMYCCCIFFFLEEKEGDSTANTAALSTSIDKLKAVDLDKKRKAGRVGGCCCSVPVIALL